MAKLSTDELLDAFKDMTLLELSEFVKKFEDTFEVTAAAPVAVAAAGPAAVPRPRPPRRRTSSTSSSRPPATRRSRSSRSSASSSRAWASRRPRTSSSPPRSRSWRACRRRPPRPRRPSCRTPAPRSAWPDRRRRRAGGCTHHHTDRDGAPSWDAVPVVRLPGGRDRTRRDGRPARHRAPNGEASDGRRRSPPVVASEVTKRASRRVDELRVTASTGDNRPVVPRKGPLTDA